MKRRNLQHLLLLALLTAMALTLFLVEAQFPLPIPLPGVKLGLANLVTLFLLTNASPKDALAVLLVRILLGTLFTGQLLGLCYSLVGGLCSLGVMCLLHRCLGKRSIWFTSVMGGVSHNLGQLVVALCLLGVGGVLYYLPFLLISGVLMGLLMGLVTQCFLQAWDRLHLQK